MANIHVNEIITQQFIDSLNKGIIPWRKGWINGSVLTGNYVTKKEYSLLNKMLLSHSGLHMSFKQMQEKHAEIVKTCPAHLIGKEIGKKNPYIMTQEKWESLTDSAKFALLSDIITFYKVEDKDTGKKDDEGKPIMEKRFTLRYYKVIWEGYTNLYKPVEPVNTEPRITACDALMKYYSDREGVRYIEEDGSEAFYRPATDEIHLPSASRFKYMEEFYSTAFHETTHSTGNKKRLDRDMSGGFGSKSYAREELVAEIGASFLTNHFGIRTNEVEENNIAYVQGWIQRLQKDPDLIIKAAQKAQKAVDFILDGFEEPKEEPKEEEKKRGEKKVKKEKKTPTAKKEGATKRRSSLEVLADKLRNSKGGSVTYLPGAMVAVTDSYTMIVTDLKDLHNIPEQNPLPVESIKKLIKSSETDTSLTLPDKLIPLIKMRVKETGVKRAVPLIKLLNGAVVDVRRLEPALKAVGSNFVCFNSNAPFKPISVHEGNWHTHIIICPMRVEDAVWLDSQSGYVRMTKDGYTRN